MMIAGTPRSRWLVALLLAVIVTRIPLLLTSYSSDADAWRVAHVGKIFWQTGAYSVSRFPGYPLHEIANGLFALIGGSFLSNAATLVVSLILIVVWYRFVEEHTASPRVLAVLLAFTPLFWIDSAATLDYVWSLLCIVLSLSAVRQKKAIAGGIWLGCAIGFRPTNAAAVVPLFMLLYLSSVPRRARATFILSAIASSLVAFSPLLFTYGLTGWIQQTFRETSDAHLPFVQRVLSFFYRSVYSLGPLAVFAIGAVLASRRHKLALLVREREPIIITSIIGIIVFALLFAFFPLDRSYLLPAFPFLYLIIDRLASKQVLVAITWCVVSFAFINPDVVQHARPVGSAGFNIHTGIVIQEWESRDKLLKERDSIAKLPINGRAVVLLGVSELYLLENVNAEPDTSQRWRQSNDYVAHSIRNPDLHFLSGLPLNAVRMLQSEGYTFYCMGWAKEKMQLWHGYVPEEEGITIIKL
jgi:hypothetical protein